jgi:hypothetical protein
MIGEITVTKHLDSNNKHPEVLLSYDLMEGVANKEKILLATKPNLFLRLKLSPYQNWKFSML